MHGREKRTKGGPGYPGEEVDAYSLDDYIHSLEARNEQGMDRRLSQEDIYTQVGSSSEVVSKVT